jgi:hypothetical protein
MGSRRRTRLTIDVRGATTTSWLGLAFHPRLHDGVELWNADPGHDAAARVGRQARWYKLQEPYEPEAKRLLFGLRNSFKSPEHVAISLNFRDHAALK